MKNPFTQSFFKSLNNLFPTKKRYFDPIHMHYRVEKTWIHDDTAKELNRLSKNLRWWHEANGNLLIYQIPNK